MNAKNISYHTRLDGNHTVRVCGGSFGGQIDADTVERLVKAHFKVTVKPSGRCVFVDREGREVSVYLNVDAATTEAGKQALAEDRKARAERDRIEDDKRREAQALIDEMGTDELLRLLKGADE